ncbi:hypothetical protein MJO29_007049 [Puccinia striiformis f. sp. tritici]|uniref:Uncharacterized protein n=2 Tax=Puccinia striiformis TaxID=27350 RepID=A0A2S4VHI1_9BASI|nr:hypothetical protein MJO29_007049 [Puccinia striiformis f. sp. tritici]KAI9622763.1 hypothetical protein H4Q26_015046 [Puccinia striiformis f. sp. tritici PST-130]POW08938.1 hypothetical protein PSHT_09334 [Puccinia striiformis]
MAQPRTSNVFQAPEEMPDQRNSDVIDEPRRLQILQSTMAKLEGLGNSKPVMNRPSPIKTASAPIYPTLMQHQPQPMYHQFGPSIHYTPPQLYSPTALLVPYYIYPPVVPNNSPNMQYHHRSNSMYPSRTPSSPSPKNPLPPPGEFRNMQNNKQRSTIPAPQRHHTTNNDVMKTPERSTRTRPPIVSPDSSPDSYLKTPPHYNSSRKQASQHQPDFRVEPQHRHLDRHSHKEPRADKINTRPSMQHQSHSNRSDKNMKDNYANLIKSGNYGLQLESKKTGVKLVEKKRLTINELKLLEALPPLPPRPQLQRSSLSSSSNLSSPPKKKKADKFAWFDYCEFFYSLYNTSTESLASTPPFLN